MSDPSTRVACFKHGSGIACCLFGSIRPIRCNPCYKCMIMNGIERATRVQLIAASVEMNWVVSAQPRSARGPIPGFGWLQSVLMGGALAGLRHEYLRALSTAAAPSEAAAPARSSSEFGAVSNADTSASHSRHPVLAAGLERGAAHGQAAAA